ncbi:MAG: GNAT family N-acetyltransferase [Pseudomonadota bacterium]|nr:GNAT family N-acetyltransferase [Pseudomonadota bacterium]
MSPPASPRRVHVAPVTDALADGVRGLRVTPEQYAFVGDVGFNLIDAERDPLSEAMVVLLDDAVIGFYRLDFAPNAVAGRGLGTGMHGEPAIGLRAMMLDRSVQGRGHGVSAVRACIEDARERHPGRALLVLAVHGCNRAGLACYRQAGFVDTGDHLFGGQAGPQTLMLFRLHPDNPGVPSP